MKTITITNRKGGTGKTTISTHLAAGLTLRGQHVVLIDTDSQGGCSLAFGLQAQDALYEVMTNGVALQEALVAVDTNVFRPEQPPTPVGSLRLLASAGNTFKIPYEVTSQFALMRVIQELEAWGNCDLVIIDTNPTVTGFDSAVSTATDAFLYVTQLEMDSVLGMQEAMKQNAIIAEDRRAFMGRDTKTLGIVPNMTRLNTAAHQYIYEHLTANYSGLLWEPLPLRIAWSEAKLYGRMVFNHATDRALDDAWQLIEQFLQRIKAL